MVVNISAGGDISFFSNTDGLAVLIVNDDHTVDINTDLRITGALYVDGLPLDPTDIIWERSGDDVYYADDGNVGIGVYDLSKITDSLTVNQTIRLIPRYASDAVPTCNGDHEGALYYDYVVGRLKICVNSAWINVGADDSVGYAATAGSADFWDDYDTPSG